MKISLITVTYNSEATIKDTLESVAHQIYPNIEHIIVDGGFKDSTLSILESYTHISILISVPNSGIYEAMNQGIRCATGDIIGILNSDDFYTNKEVIAEIAHFFNQNTAVQAVYADLIYVDRVETNRITRVWKAGNFDKKQFLKGWTLPHPTFFVRKSVYEQLGVFNESFKIAADYELILRFLYKNEVQVAYLPMTILKMRTGGASNGNLRKRFLAHQEDQLAWAVNQLQPPFYTIYLKPIRKIVQFQLFTKFKSYFKSFYESKF